MTLAALDLTYKPKDVIQFFIRVLVLLNLIALIYMSFRANTKAIENISTIEYKFYLGIQIYTLAIFCLDLLISDIFGCCDFYIKLYKFSEESDREELERECKSRAIMLRVLIRGVLILMDFLKILFSMRVLWYLKLVYKSSKMNVFDNEIMKSEPVVRFSH